jgi:hypothetical protein
MSRESQLVLVPLDDRAWRLCDRSIARNDPANVVAYVELLPNDVYEVIWVSVGFGTVRYASLDRLLDDAMKLMSCRRSSGALKPAPIPHRPPAHV